MNKIILVKSNQSSIRTNFVIKHCNDCSNTIRISKYILCDMISGEHSEKTLSENIESLIDFIELRAIESAMSCGFNIIVDDDVNDYLISHIQVMIKKHNILANIKKLNIEQYELEIQDLT